MGGFEVGIEGLRKSATSAVSAGAQAEQIRLGQSVAPVIDALPGSTAAQQAHALQDVWQERLRAWSDDVREFGSALAQTAENYQHADDVIRGDLDVISGLLERFTPLDQVGRWLR